MVVEFGDTIARDLSDRVLGLSQRVRAAGLPGVSATVPTFRSLLIHFDPLATDSAGVIAATGKLLDDQRNEARRVRLWRVPACYAVSHAPDLEDVAQRTHLTTAEIIALHAGTRYHIYMIGFVPGFAYLGNLPETLVLPRRVDPRVRVPAGSIAIATHMTAVYPFESPGGWHLIGASPIRLFDLRWTRPALFSPGDAVQFEPVSVAEYDAVSAAVAAGTYQVSCETIAA